MAIPIEAACPEQDDGEDTKARNHIDRAKDSDLREIADELDCLEARTIHEADLLFRAAAALRQSS